MDYFGRAVSILDRTTGRVVVQGEDDHLVHEAVYHFLLSRIGEHLDAQGLTRTTAGCPPLAGRAARNWEALAPLLG